MLTLTNPFFKAISESLAAEAKKSGYQVLTVSGEFKPETQRDQVKDFIVKKCAAIVLTPCDSRAVGTSIAEANAAGIPVFTADIKSLSTEGKVVSHIATDNLAGGREAGNAMIEALGAAGGKVAIIHHPTVESCILRVKGFRETIEAHNASGKGAKMRLWPNFPAAAARRARSRPPKTPSREMRTSLLPLRHQRSLRLGQPRRPRESQGLNVKIVGFDGQPDAKAAIKQGKIYADPVQSPEEIGRPNRPSHPQAFRRRKSRTGNPDSHDSLPPVRRAERPCGQITAGRAKPVAGGGGGGGPAARRATGRRDVGGTSAGRLLHVSPPRLRV